MNVEIIVTVLYVLWTLGLTCSYETEVFSRLY